MQRLLHGGSGETVTGTGNRGHVSPLSALSAPRTSQQESDIRFFFLTDVDCIAAELKHNVDGLSSLMVWYH